MRSTNCSATIMGRAIESSQTLTLDTVGAAIGGTVQIVGRISCFTPLADYNGLASFQYTFHDDGTTNGSADPQTGSATVSFTIFEVNDPPTAGNDSLPAITEDFGPFPIFLADLLANDSTGPANEASQALTVSRAYRCGGRDGADQWVANYISAGGRLHWHGEFCLFLARQWDDRRALRTPKTATAVVSFRVTEINDVPIGHDDSLANIPEDFGPRTIPLLPCWGTTRKDRRTKAVRR